MKGANREMGTSKQGTLDPAPITNPVEAARFAGLRYVSDTIPGIQRKRAGTGFYYVKPDGSRLTDRDELKRIRSLVIPPAWTDVWICPFKNGHLQATGRDARRRKQYRYHPLWREIRDETKYRRLVDFARSLPKIREQVDLDLSELGLSKRRVLATVVRLLESTLIRVGNEEYAKTNRSYGLTTLRDRHAEVDGAKLRFRFRGKSGKDHCIGIRDRRLAKIVRRCQDLPGQELFQYTENGSPPTPIGSSDVNEYIREISGEDFTAKDFRTWAGTLAAAAALQEFGVPSSLSEAKKNVTQVVKQVAERLGNTPSTCRKFYIHPVIIEAYMDGSLPQMLGPIAKRVYALTVHKLDEQENSLVGALEASLAKLS